MKKVLNYEEGTWFLVPIRDNACVAGVVARVSPTNYGVLLGYFFPQLYTTRPELDVLCDLKPSRAKTCMIFGHIGLLSREWPIVGKCVRWSSSEWPMPTFVRKNPLNGQRFEISYNDNDPAIQISEQPISDEDKRNLEQDGLFGHGAVRRYLAHLLGYEVPPLSFGAKSGGGKR